MADIFISYVREDRNEVRKLVGALKERGWSVWWDPELIAGEHYDRVIERELDNAKSIVVVWSSTSLTSDNVRNEAVVGRDRRCLIQVTILGASWPSTFAGWQAVDLSGWSGDSSDPRFEELCSGIRRVAPRSASDRQVDDLLKRYEALNLTLETGDPPREPKEEEVLLSRCVILFMRAWLEDDDLREFRRSPTLDNLLNPPKPILIRHPQRADKEAIDASSVLRECMKALYQSYVVGVEQYLQEGDSYVGVFPLRNRQANSAADVLLQAAKSLHKATPRAKPIPMSVWFVDRPA